MHPEIVLMLEMKAQTVYQMLTKLNQKQKTRGLIIIWQRWKIKADPTIHLETKAQTQINLFWSTLNTTH